jgi:hypothetical protein
VGLRVGQPQSKHVHLGPCAADALRYVCHIIDFNGAKKNKVLVRKDDCDEKCWRQDDV